MSRVEIQTPDALLYFDVDSDEEAAQHVRYLAELLRVARGLGASESYVYSHDVGDNLPFIVRADQVLSIYVAEEAE